jgi:diguanylate cyclase (GGDEF)-like protein
VSQARILVVDDQLYFRVFLEDLLKEAGYEVRCASSGAEALALLGVESFDVVLTDLVMPEMDGSELVQRIKERWPAQEVVVVTSVGDVRTAVDAMKIGATDYWLKPLDRTAALRSLAALLQQRRIREEHRQLVQENLEYLNVFAQYERVLALFSTLDVEALADRIVETFCLETSAHGGVLWLARQDAPDCLRLAGVGGLVRVEEESAELGVDALPATLAPLASGERRALLVPGGEGARGALYLALRHDAVLLGLLRLSDRLDGGDFSAADLDLVQRLGGFAAQAVANALRFRSVERRSFRDAATGAYTRAYFEDVVHNEIQKAHRFSRSFALVRVRLEGAADLRERLAPAELGRWLQQVTRELSGSLRATDLLAAEDDGQLIVLLPEADALGATIAKRRLRVALERASSLRELEATLRPTPLAASVVHPADGPTLEALRHELDRRIECDRDSALRALNLQHAPFRAVVDALLAEAPAGRSRTAEQMTRVLFDEVRRRPHERGLLLVAPGASLLAPLRDGLDELRGLEVEAQVVLVADRRPDLAPGVPVTWVSPARAGTDAPFAIYFGEGTPYAILRKPRGNDGELSIYHTSDPVVVEQLAFQLGRDLGIPIGE